MKAIVIAFIFGIGFVWFNVCDIQNKINQFAEEKFGKRR